MRSSAPSRLDHPGALAEIHLGFLARRAFHPPKRQRLGLTQRAHEPLHRVIPTYGLAVYAQFPGVPPLRPASLTSLRAIIDCCRSIFSWFTAARSPIRAHAATVTSPQNGWF